MTRFLSALNAHRTRRWRVKRSAWRLRARDWVLVVALTGSWAIFFARAVDEGLHTGRGRVNVSLWSAAARDAYPTVRDVPSRDWNR